MFLTLVLYLLLVLRVRPLSNKEIKDGDEMAVHFPGDGQIHVSPKIWCGDDTDIVSNNHKKHILYLFPK